MSATLAVSGRGPGGTKLSNGRQPPPDGLGIDGPGEIGGMTVGATITGADEQPDSRAAHSAKTASGRRGLIWAVIAATPIA